MIHPKFSQQQGVMMLITLIFLALLWFVVLAFSSSTVDALRLSQRSIASEQASWAAEAGLRLAIAAVTKDANYTPPSGWTKMGLKEQSYRVVLRKQSAAPIPIPPDCLYLESTGLVDWGPTRKAVAVVRPGSGKVALNFSVFADNLTLIGGSRIDSFDSKVSQWVRGSAATVATNSVTAGAIRLIGGSWIQGAIQVGVGGKTGLARPATPTNNSANVVWKDWSTWSLEETNLTSPIEFAPVAAPAAGTNSLNVDWRGMTVTPGAYGELRASGGGEVRLSGGTYVFKSINLTGGAKLSFSGSTPATVYVTQDFDLSGGTFNNTTAIPRNVVFMLAKGVKARMTGGAQAFAVIYGPEAEFSITGGTDLYGAIVAKSVTLQSGASIHYDTDLAKNPPAAISGSSGASGASVISYQRF